MNKYYSRIIIIILLLVTNRSYSTTTWEKLYSKKSTDCFRSVREVASGGYVLAGYTANFTPNDTDGLVVRLDANGDTMWTFVYNGPANRYDLFYKVLQTADGGFVLCGYSNSFSVSEDVIVVKLNASGQFQWVSNWGGSGKENAEDIIQLPDGKYVICGSTTSSPAHYYDAFLLKIDQTGNILWSKNYGTTSYDDVTSLLLLADGGFLAGGQSSNQYYLIRTNSNGDTVWTRSFGTSGIDKIECINYAQGGNGFVLVGTTDGIGAGAEDAYLVRTDTGGNTVWAKTYGAALNDGFHRIEPTSDGGYIGTGTSNQGPLTSPNYWLVKLDVNGNLTWQNWYGGNDHDHGYSGQQTSDGGFIIAGHTHSFMSNTNNEDALVIKTDATGQVSNELTWTTVTKLLSPLDSTCGSATAQVKVEVANYGIQTVSNIPVTVVVTGAITQTLNQTYTSSVAPNATMTMIFTTTIDMSGGGTFNFHCYTGNPHNVIPVHNYLDVVKTVGGIQPPIVTNGTHCGPGTVILSATSLSQIQWFDSLTGGSVLVSGTTFTTPYLTTNTTYFVQSGGGCQSSRVPVNATISTGLTSPVPIDNSRCGTGIVTLSATSTYPIIWYSGPTSTFPLGTGTTYSTPSIASSISYYIQADNSTCTSNRVVVNANILSPPADPVTGNVNHCGPGTVSLSATSSDPLNWYDGATSGNLVGTGNTFNTPSLTNSTTYYVQAINVNCSSNVIAAIAIVDLLPNVNIGLDTILCSSASFTFDAGTGFSSYLWSTSETSQTYTANSDGNYCVTVTDANNCTASDCTFLEFTTGINTDILAGSFEFYPSPSHGIISIKWNEKHSHLKFSLLDLTGKTIYDNSTLTDQESLDLSFLPEGVYFVKFSDVNTTVTKKLVIE